MISRAVAVAAGSAECEAAGVVEQAGGIEPANLVLPESSGSTRWSSER